MQSQQRANELRKVGAWVGLVAEPLMEDRMDTTAFIRTTGFAAYWSKPSSKAPAAAISSASRMGSTRYIRRIQTRRFQMYNRTILPYHYAHLCPLHPAPSQRFLSACRLHETTPKLCFVKQTPWR
jgi:hypothetical protein